jgi:acetyl esterase/lipase
MTSKLMTADDLGLLTGAPPGERIAYGSDPLQFGELTIPVDTRLCPVIVNVHGGVWLAEYGIDHSRAQARALADSGFAVWNLEYRRLGNPGGGWPGTFKDVSMGVEHLRRIASQRSLDLNRVCLMGHSAGGQLALWLAARSRVLRDSPLFSANPLPVRGVVALAPASELPELHARAVFDGTVDKLMGGSPQDVPERYAAVTPALLAPAGVRQILIVGQHDDVWGWNAPAYLAAARAAGDTHTQLIVADGAGHFELISPGSSAWPTVVAAARTILS